MPYRPIYYDTETTGIRPSEDRIVEIAAYDPVLDRSFVSLINPGCPIPPQATAISHITDEMVADAPSFAEVGADFISFCEGEVVLIAHNNDTFDQPFIECECQRNGLTLPPFAYIDSLKWARKYRPDLPKHALQYLRGVYGIEANQAHRALDDVKVLYRIFSLMIGDLSMESVMELLSKKGPLVRTMPFGKHKGIPLKKLPKGYTTWLLDSGILDKPNNASLKESLSSIVSSLK